MDLRSIINNEAGESSAQRQQATPVTPIQAGLPQQAFREYSHPPQASPGKHPSQDYGAAPQGGPYASPASYQGSYPARPPPPPPIQPPPQHELRSPAGSYSAQSPYRQTPTSSISSNQYPFPQTHQTPQSPAQHQQYPPSYPRDSYSQSNPPPPHLQHHNSQNQVSPAPQTPPIGIPGQPHPYLQHQRSQSSLSGSTPTPTSAQSQPPYYNQFPHDSPVPASHFPPSQPPPSQLPQNQRQPSHPGTPLGPPISQRQSSGGFPQPTSPYQQRRTSSGPFANYQQTSPAPPPVSTPRLPSTPSGYDSQRTSTSEQQRRSQSERERSLSVSPKTRLPSTPRENISIQQHENPYSNPAKRKMEDRETPVEEPRRSDHPGTKSLANGNHQVLPVNSSPQQPARKRMRYTEPPIWAQSVRAKKFSGLSSHAITANGMQPTAGNVKQAAPQPLIKSETNGHEQMYPAPTRPGPQPDLAADDPSLILGPWERSITGRKPVEQITKEVADFFFHNVVSRNDIGELHSRGVEIEIEAKLGQLVDKDTNVRYQLPVVSECVLAETARIGFKSSMTEVQHRSLNEFLNARVAETHPNNPGAKKRVPIDYLHRRENDKFYELPPSHLANLPAAVRQMLNPRHTVKVRVTYDQKTNKILAAIIKTRIADLDIYNPRSPLDCRISINFEMRYDGDLEDLMSNAMDNRIPDRSKDRLSYTQSHYQIDLTQVTQVTSVNGATRVDKEHELEIEVSTSAIREQGLRAKNGQPHEYYALVEGMIDNMRVLANAVPPQ